MSTGHKDRSEDGYSQDSDFDSELSYSTYASDDESNDQSSVPTTVLGDHHHHEKDCKVSNFIIREDPNNRKKSPAPKRKMIPTYNISRLKELSKSRQLLPEPPPTKEKKKSTRKSFQDFIERQEALEKNRIDKRMRKKMELEYEDKANKRKCPRCGQVQSFDEFQTRKKTCPKDGATYAFSSSFSMKSFEGRMFLSRCKKQQTMDRIRGERLLTLEKFEKKAAHNNGMDNFLKRMCNDLVRRKNSLHQLRIKEVKRVMDKGSVS